MEDVTEMATKHTETKPHQEPFRVNVIYDTMFANARHGRDIVYWKCLSECFGAA